MIFLYLPVDQLLWDTSARCVGTSYLEAAGRAMALGGGGGGWHGSRKRYLIVFSVKIIKS